jgi:hypothetical protein
VSTPHHRQNTSWPGLSRPFCFWGARHVMQMPM